MLKVQRKNFNKDRFFYIQAYTNMKNYNRILYAYNSSLRTCQIQDISNVTTILARRWVSRYLPWRVSSLRLFFPPPLRERRGAEADEGWFIEAIYRPHCRAHFVRRFFAASNLPRTIGRLTLRVAVMIYALPVERGRVGHFFDVYYAAREESLEFWWAVENSAESSATWFSNR